MYRFWGRRSKSRRFHRVCCSNTSWIDKDAAPPCTITSLPRTAENPALKSPNLDIFTEEDSSGVIRIFGFGKLQGVGTT